MKKQEPMDYIYKNKSGSPHTFLELYGKDELFKMLDRDYIKINGYSVKNWSITKEGRKATVKYNPGKYKCTLKDRLLFLIHSLTSKSF